MAIGAFAGKARVLRMNTQTFELALLWAAHAN